MGIFSIANRGMEVAQKKLNVAGSNLASLSTELPMEVVSYTSTTMLDRQFGGVEVSSLERKIPVEAQLLKDLRSAIQNTNYHEVMQNTLRQIMGKIGRIEGQENLAQMCGDFLNACTSLSATPSSPAYQNDVLYQLNRMTAYLKSTSDTILTERQQAERDISNDIDMVNKCLKDIHELNLSIAEQNGEDTAYLETKRDAIMIKLSKYIDFTTFQVKSTGALHLTTMGGAHLLDNSPNLLHFTPTGGLTLDSVYPQTAQGINIYDDQGSPLDITHAFSSGSIAANVVLRDTTLPAIQAELDTFALTLKQVVNDINNLGARIPVSSSLVGTQGFEQGINTGFQAQGTLRVAVVEQEGTLVGYHDFDMSNYNSLESFIEALQQNLDQVDNTLQAGLQGDDHHLELSVQTPGRGLALTSVGATAIEQVSGKNISHYFGLNDLIVSGPEATQGLARTLSVQSQALSYAQLKGDENLQVNQIVIAKGDGSVMEQLIQSFNQSRLFPAAGYLNSHPQTLIDYAASIVTDLAYRLSAEQDALESAADKQQGSEVELANVASPSMMEQLYKIAENVQFCNAQVKVLEAQKQIIDMLLEVR